MTNVLKHKSGLMVLIACVTVLIMCFSVAFASTADEERQSAYNALQGYEDSTGDTTTVEGTLKTIANVLVGVAFVISLIKLVQIGFKFMLGAGNKKSDAKASLIPWAIGVFVCAMWLTLGNWFMEVLTSGGLGSGGPFDI